MTAPALHIVRDSHVTISEDPALRPVSFDDFIGQTEVIANLRGAVRAAKRGGWQLDHMLMAGGAGLGKCLGEGTPVLLADGRVLPVEQLVTGDRLMGPDGKARTILSTTTGMAPLFRIEPIKGEAWVCNDVHVLTLVNTNTDKIVDVPLDQWHMKSQTFRQDHKQFSVGVDAFEGMIPHHPIDPYFLGVWFGDGTKELRTVAITKPDPEIKLLCEEQAAKWELHVRTETSQGTRCPSHFLSSERGQGNRLLRTLRDLVGTNVTVPESYLRASREIRLQFLAGFLDADAELADTTFVISQKREDWARAVWWVARSLGFYAGIKTRSSRWTRADGSVHEGTYWVVSISGDTHLIPMRIPRKQATVRQQKKVATRSGFAPISIGEGAYYGFTLDGDGRFLLGDFTVTHNTSIASIIAAELGTKLVVTSAPAIEHKGSIAALLTTLEDGDVLFIDEIHALGREVSECLYTALEDRVIDLPAGKRVIRVPLPKFTLLGATTHAGKLPKPLLDRFGFVWQLRPYTLPEMTTIVSRSATMLGVAIEDDAAAVIAAASRGVPRIANRLLRRVRDVAANAAADGGLVLHSYRGARDIINGALATTALTQLGIDSLGLDSLDRRYLAMVADRPVGIEALCAGLAEDRSTIADTVEPYLMAAGLIRRDARGRVATDAGREHLVQVTAS